MLVSSSGDEAKAVRLDGGSSETFSSVSNSSRIRVSTESGSLRVTMTFGLRAGMCLQEKGMLPAPLVAR